MALFWATVSRDSISFLRFPFIRHVHVFSCEILHCCCLDYCIKLLPFPFLFSRYSCSVILCVVCVVSGCCNQTFFVLFLSSLWVILSMYRRYLRCWRVIVLLLFLTHTVCLCHLRDVVPYALLLVFLFSNQFVEVLPSFTLRLVPSILQEGHPWYLSFWWDICYVVWIFSFSSSLLCWCLLPIFSSISKFPFFWEFWFFSLFKRKVSKVGDFSRGSAEGSFFNSYYIKVLGRALLLLWFTPLYPWSLL